MGAAFWIPGELPADPVGDLTPPVTHAASVRRLGGFPFWRGREPLLDALEPMYARAAAHALDVLAGGGKPSRKR